MAKRVSLAVALAMFVAISATLVAGPQVTLILRSGNRVTGELIDLDGSGFRVRVGGADQNIPKADVAVIEFGGDATPSGEANRIQDGRAFVVLRGGDTFEGRLYDIGGTNPLRITFRTPDGDRDVNSDQVARIYLSPWQGMSTSPEGQTDAALDPGGAGVAVPANVCWTNTRRSVRQGQRVTFNGSGEIQLSADRNDVAGVAGSRTGRTSPNAPIPGALAGALIGRVGNSRPFGIGDQTIALGMPASGQLWLGINDDHCGDNRGQFKVQINILR